MAVTAEDLGVAGRDNAYGHGLIQAKDAVDYLATQLCTDGTVPNIYPTASFSFSCDNLALTCVFDGHNSSDSDGTIASYDWDFGDGSIGSDITPSHTYTTAGNFTVTLTVTDNAGDSNLSSQDVQIIDASGDVTLPVISDVSSTKLNGNSFKVTWTTDEQANSVVNLTCCGEFSNSTLTTSHSMSFRGSRGALYEYSVSSTDAAGNTSTSRPYPHQN